MHMMLRTRDTLIGKSYDEHEVSADSSKIVSSRERSNGDTARIIRRYNEIHGRVGKIVVFLRLFISPRGTLLMNRIQTRDTRRRTCLS